MQGSRGSGGRSFNEPLTVATSRNLPVKCTFSNAGVRCLRTEHVNSTCIKRNHTASLAFDAEQKRLDLPHPLNQIPDVKLVSDAIERRPSILLETLERSEITKEDTRVEFGPRHV